MNQLLNLSRSLVFENRDNQLIEIPVIEYIQNYKNNICRLIKYAINPNDEFEDYKFILEYDGLEEEIRLSDCNLDQAIKIAIMLNIDEKSIHYNPDYFVIISHDKKEYTFNKNIFDSQSSTIFSTFAQLMVDICNLRPMDLARLRLPPLGDCYLDQAILEINANRNTIPTLAIIDKKHSKWQGYMNYYYNRSQKIQLDKLFNE
jgi:hypothetical protein